MFVFRVAAKPGLGHLMRMRVLAQQLSLHGHASVFILCAGSEHLLGLLEPVARHCHVLPELKSELKNELEDARQTSALIETYPDVRSVILDHPQFSELWERCLVEAEYHVVAFDDMARTHQAHMLFDPKWLGARTAQRYVRKLPSDSHAFLGPDYCLLAAPYSSRKPGASSESPSSQASRAEACHILLSLGGGGDLSLLESLLTALLQNEDSKHLSFDVVVGPLAKNGDGLKALAQHYPSINLVTGQDSLYDYYVQADLFIGALGTSLYELAATRTPALTFSMSPDQHNELKDLADFGHYLHLSDIAELASPICADLVLLLSQQKERLNQLIQRRHIDIDGRGAERICEVLLNPEASATRAGVSVSVRESEPLDVHEFTPELAIRAVQDSDLHAYLAARNQRNNAAKSTVTREIALLEHYHWWFRTARESYVLTRHGEPLLFLWQQAYRANQKNYYYGGWFTADESVSFNIPMLALRWQLEQSRAECPDAHWVAVIRKDNRFVNLLNQYMGFSQIQNPDTLSVTRQLFPQADQASFNFIELDFSA